MHWEGTAPWAPPIVWPPYGGEEELKKLIDALHSRGDILGVYTSGLGWTINSNVVDNYNTQEYFDKHNLKEEMCISPSRPFPIRIYVRRSVPATTCAPPANLQRETVKQQVRFMVGVGIDYIQLMDQNHGGTSYFCYSQKHDHPPMPGKWQTDAVRSLLSEVNKETDKVLFGL